MCHKYVAMAGGIKAKSEQKLLTSKNSGVGISKNNIYPHKNDDIGGGGGGVKPKKEKVSIRNGCIQYTQ